MKMGRVDGMRAKGLGFFGKIKAGLKKHSGTIQQVAQTAGDINPVWGAKIAAARAAGKIVKDAAGNLRTLN